MCATASRGSKSVGDEDDHPPWQIKCDLMGELFVDEFPRLIPLVTAILQTHLAQQQLIYGLC